MTRAEEPQRIAAAKEVAASLAPFIVAAQTHRVLPKRVWADPYICGYVLGYCAGALRKLSTPDAPTVDVFLVLIRVYEDTFRTDLPISSIPDDQKDWKQEFKEGYATAFLVLAVFAGNEEVKRHPHVQAAIQTEFEPGYRSNEPPPTQLHPYGEHNWAGRRAMLTFFSRRLMALGVEE